MSTLKVNTIQDTSGGSGSTPAQIEQGRAKAWINFNGTGVIAIRDDYGVSSISDLGTGDYRVTYDTAMGNANYCVLLGEGQPSTTDGTQRTIGDLTTTYVEFETGKRHGSGSSDRISVYVAVFGDS